MSLHEMDRRNQSTSEPPKKKKKSDDDEQLRFTKETLLKALKDVENEIPYIPGLQTLRVRLETLRGEIKGILQSHEKKIKNLEKEIQSLKEEVESQREENKKLVNEALIAAHATWVWEAHVARFVVDSSRQIYETGKFRQMKRYIQGSKDPRHNRWTEIQSKLGITWTDDHWTEIKSVRDGRNSKAHPYLIDVDLLKSKIKTVVPPESRKLIEDMLNILKMTASLMKFGKLAMFYKKNKRLFPTVVRGRIDTRALECILSWDRNFDEIDGLQNIKHTEAKKYLKMYVSNPRKINDYYFIVDFIKEGNSKRLGKLAWEFQKRYVDGISTEHRRALTELKKLLPSPDNEGKLKSLDYTIAKLHIPDFLPKNLWKHGIEIVETYFAKKQKTLA